MAGRRFFILQLPLFLSCRIFCLAVCCLSAKFCNSVSVEFFCCPVCCLQTGFFFAYCCLNNRSRQEQNKCVSLLLCYSLFSFTHYGICRIALRPQQQSGLLADRKKLRSRPKSRPLAFFWSRRQAINLTLYFAGKAFKKQLAVKQVILCIAGCFGPANHYVNLPANVYSILWRSHCLTSKHKFSASIPQK